QEIEAYLGKTITVLGIGKKDYHETLEFTGDTDDNWKQLIREGEQMQKKKKRKKGR
ncbi:MAG: ATP-dependent helicase, partial [Chlorobi bacterium]|nr:ATP-dependent helicase [Chlorobiota bacterium]